MRKTGMAALFTVLAAGSAMAGDVGVIKGPGWWGPIYVRDPSGLDVVYAMDGVAVGSGRGGPGAEAAGAAAGAGPAGRLSAVVPAGSDRATLLKLRQALAEEAARRGLR